MCKKVRRKTSVPVWWDSALKAWEIAVAAPQVIAHRTARMTTAGPFPTARDRREFTRMGQEKVEAFGKSFIAMAMEMQRTQQELALLATRQWWDAWTAGLSMASGSPAKIMAIQSSLMRGLTAGAAGEQFAASVSRVVEKGLAPVHRTATRNAKRLRGRKKRRQSP